VLVQIGPDFGHIIHIQKILLNKQRAWACVECDATNMLCVACTSHDLYWYHSSVCTEHVNYSRVTLYWRWLQVFLSCTASICLVIVRST